MSDTEVDFAGLVKKSQSLGIEVLEEVFTDGILSKEPEHYKECSGFCVKSIDTEKRQVTALASASTLDRHDEIVQPEAFKQYMPVYMKNPVVITSHLHRLQTGHSSVVGQVIKFWIDKQGLWVVIQFSDKTELAREYWGLYSDKTQRAFSIGFIEHEGKGEIIDGRQVYIHTVVELLEISCVAVGANPEALSKSKQRKLDFVHGKIQQRIFDNFWTNYINEHPDFEAEAEEYAMLTAGYNETAELDIDFSEIVKGVGADGCELTAADNGFADLVKGRV